MSDLSKLSTEQKTVVRDRIISVVNTVEQAFSELYDIDLSIRIARKDLSNDGTVESGSALVRLNDIVEDLEHLIDRLEEDLPNEPR